MANLTTTFDLKQAALKHCGELTDGTSSFEDRMLDYLNRVYTEIICGGSTFVPDLCEPWVWARMHRPGLLTLVPPFASGLGGSVALTNDSKDGFFAIAPNEELGSFAGRFLHLDGRPDVYRVETHVKGSQQFLLDQEYSAPTIAASGFSCVKLDFVLTPGIVRLVEPFRCFARQLYEGNGEGKIQGLSTDELHRRFPLYGLFSTGSRTPTHFAIINERLGVITVRFNTVVFENARVEYEYVPIPTPLSISDPLTDPLPRIPPEHRSVLALGAAYWLMVDKEDPRQDLYMRLTQSKIQGMLLERRREFEDETRDFARLNPRQDQFLWRRDIRSTSGVRYP